MTRGASGRRIRLGGLGLSRSACVWIALALLPLTSGQLCNTVSGQKFQNTQRALQKSEERVEELEQQSLEQQTRIRNLEDQVAELRHLGPEEFKDLIVPVEIRLADLSGPYDRDGKPGDDGLILYIQPIDADGHVIKAAGELLVKVFDLSKSGAETELSIHKFDRSTTRAQWYGRMWTHHFTVRCPWVPGHPPTSDEVTAYVQFTDLLTGRVLTTQKAFHIRPPPPDSGSQ